jgi:ABC-type Fe3+-hydroxamate transport system substrate-binding protein
MKHRSQLRVVSLVPSMTETLLDWGIEPVACTRFCEQPELPHVGGTKDPDVAAIRDLGPDLVLVDAEENRLEDYEALLAAGLEVVALHVRSVDDVAAQLDPLAERLGAHWRMPVLPQPLPAGPSAFVPIWRRPWMALGTPTYGSSVLEHVGVSNTFAADPDTYPETTLEEVRAREPEVVLAPSEPYPFRERHREELDSVAPTVLVDGKDLLWWGTRTAGAIERLAAVAN